MTLVAIALMIVGALAGWLLRQHRANFLLITSIFALFALQPVGLELALPAGTLLLVVGIWWLTAAQPAGADWRSLLLILVTAALIPCLGTLSGAGIGAALRPLPPLFAAALGALLVGMAIPRDDIAARRRLAAAMIILVILILVVLKLPALQVSVSGTLSQATGQPIPLDWQWLGFSYIAFRLMHVLLDFRSGRFQPVGLRDFALYVVFYPAIPAGPIDRVEHFAREINTADRTLAADRAVRGFTRIGIGMFKKFVLADLLAYIALSPRLVEQAKVPTSIWLMVYAYAFRIFFDFSGYSDIAIGVGTLAGVDLPENFTAPYLRGNITQFWNSWHITLSTWFRNYFFTPLSRALLKSPVRAHRHLIILIAQLCTMVLIGLWHGIALNFVLWGAWQGFGLWAHKWYSDQWHPWSDFVEARPRLGTAAKGLNIILTFHFVALGWIFFALPDLHTIIKAFAGLVGLTYG